MSKHDWIQPDVKARLIGFINVGDAHLNGVIVMLTSCVSRDIHGQLGATVEENELANGYKGFQVEHFEPVKGDETPDWEGMATRGNLLSDDEKVGCIVNNLEGILDNLEGLK